jgi:hypothetical protein
LRAWSWNKNPRRKRGIVPAGKDAEERVFFRGKTGFA